jgi:hypothetical protein
MALTKKTDSQPERAVAKEHGATGVFKVQSSLWRAMRLSPALVSLIFAPIFGCSELDDNPDADLPQGWETADRVASFEQSVCGESPSGGPSESLEIATSPGAVEVGYHHAHFRCSQTVEAFARSSTGVMDILVQPVDMDPLAVARCDCLYEITMSIAAPVGQYELTLYRRWDHKSGADEPRRVASRTVVLP